MMIQIAMAKLIATFSFEFITKHSKPFMGRFILGVDMNSSIKTTTNPNFADRKTVLFGSLLFHIGNEQKKRNNTRYDVWRGQETFL